MNTYLSFRIARKTRRPHAIEVWPLSVAVFMIVCFYLMTTHVNQPEPLVELPTSSGSCFRSFTTYDISVDKNNRVYFSIENKHIQAAVIQQVANQHGVQLGKRQLQELIKMPYIGMDVRLLPTALSVPRTKRYSLQQGLPLSASNNQLNELISVSRTLYPALTSRSISCAIRVDKQVSFAQVRQLINMLQQQHVNRFNIKTYME